MFLFIDEEHGMGNVSGHVTGSVSAKEHIPLDKEPVVMFYLI